MNKHERYWQGQQTVAKAFKRVIDRLKGEKDPPYVPPRVWDPIAKLQPSIRKGKINVLIQRRGLWKQQHLGMKKTMR